MIRRITTLGLALFAVGAISAVIAPPGLATSGTLTTFPAGKTVIATGEQTGDHVFTLTDQPFSPTVRCKKVFDDGVGTSSTGATTITVTPTFGECVGSLVFIVEHKECTFILHTGTTTGPSGWSVGTTLSCPAGRALTFRTMTCEFTFGSQELPTASELTNSGVSSPETGMDLLLHFKLTGIKYTVVKDGIGCPLSGVGNFSEGDYEGKTTIKAHDSATGAAVGVTLHD